MVTVQGGEKEATGISHLFFLLQILLNHLKAIAYRVFLLLCEPHESVTVLA